MQTYIIHTYIHTKEEWIQPMTKPIEIQVCFFICTSTHIVSGSVPIIPEDTEEGTVADQDRAGKSGTPTQKEPRPKSNRPKRLPQ